MRTVALVVVIAVFLVGFAKGQASGDPSGMWMIGFLQIQDAVKAEADNNTPLAVGEFRQALWTFHDIARRFPAFEFSPRTERIHLLSDEIRSLGGILIAFEPLVRTPAKVVKIPQPNPEAVLPMLPRIPITWVARKEYAVFCRQQLLLRL